jgi:starch-binding outer membrane protein, SusD/RagB family
MKYISFLLLLITLAFMSCKKALETKPNSAIVVPTSPQDMQGLLDNSDVFAWGTYLNYISADEYYFTPSPTFSLTPIEENASIWKPIIFDEDDISADWNNSYQQVYYSNLVIQGLARLSWNSGNKKWLEAMKGDALFKRSLAFYHLIQLFAKAYNPSSADHDLGIPLRLTIDPQERIFRSSMSACYKQMLGDLHEATQLLPSSIDPFHRNRAIRPAAFALLARMYLSMGSWQQAINAADSCLMQYDSLLDYNKMDTSLNNPFSATKTEMVYPLSMPKQNSLHTGLISTGGVNIDSMLTSLYTPADLRRRLFFRSRSDGSITLKSSYLGTNLPFTGISTAEVYLILAESHARLYQTDTALKYLNKLLMNRWRKGQFTPFTATNPTNALALILVERQKEMVFRGLRWADVKRMNMEGPKITLKRIYNGQSYNLDPNDLRYALPIPQTIIRKNGIEPNPR